MEYLDELELAGEYFEWAVSINPLNYKLNCKYAELMITFRDYQKAQKLIEYTHSIRGVNTAIVLRVESFLFEHKGCFDESIQLLEKAKQYAFNNDFMDNLNEDLIRVQSKKEATQKYIWTN